MSHTGCRNIQHTTFAFQKTHQTHNVQGRRTPHETISTRFHQQASKYKSILFSFRAGSNIGDFNPHISLESKSQTDEVAKHKLGDTV